MKPENLRFKLFKSGTLRISCKGSGHVVWVGNKYRPIKENEIPQELRNFCRRCEISSCPRKRG